MAKIFFVKDGVAQNRAKFVADIFKSEAVSLFGGYSYIYSEHEPCFNNDSNISEFSDYRYVVLKLDIDEVNETFDRSGFYVMKDLSIDRVKKILQIS